MERPLRVQALASLSPTFLTPKRISGKTSVLAGERVPTGSGAGGLRGATRDRGGYPRGTSYGARWGTIARSMPSPPSGSPTRNGENLFFRGELEQLLLLGLEGQVDAAGAVRRVPSGSHDSSSYRAYAMRQWGRKTETLGSNANVNVANYFSQHGWRRGEPSRPFGSKSRAPPRSPRWRRRNLSRRTPPSIVCAPPHRDWQDRVGGDARATLVRLRWPGG